jgi:arabinofuranosyltransferase
MSTDKTYELPARSNLLTGFTTDRRRLFFFVAAAIAVLVAILHASSLWYINDDCFVSFRYARNLVRGLGLVYNAEERVEGFTNFLWTLIIAGGIRLNLDPVMFSTTLGIVFEALTICCYALLSWCLRSGNPRISLLLPFTAIALALHRDFNAHATSGMETSMFTFLIAVSAFAVLAGDSRRSMVAAGVSLTLAMMTRPDGVIFLVAVFIYLVITRRPLSWIVALLSPVVVLFVPYWIWRWQYYGFFFPNTFYAKSIDLPYYSQGLDYTLLYFRTYYIFLLIPVVGGVILRQRLRNNRHPLGRLFGRPGPRPLLFAFLAVGMYTAFVIRIGGDFMFARFFMATTPFMYIAAELLLDELKAGQGVRGGLAVLILLGTLFRWNQYEGNLFAGYVADEAQYFTKEEQARSEAEGAMLKKYFGDLPVRVAFWAGRLKLVYYADPPYAIESSGGLTDTAVAHRSLNSRGRPGHEKQPTPEYFRERRVNFYIGPVDPPPPGQIVLNAIRFDSLLARILIYDNTIMTRLSAFPEVRFVRMPEYLDRYCATVGKTSRATVETDYAFFRSFYFAYNNDTLHENTIRRFLTLSPLE